MAASSPNLFAPRVYTGRDGAIVWDISEEDIVQPSFEVKFLAERFGFDQGMNC